MHQEYSMLETYFKWGKSTVIFFFVIFSHGIAMAIQTDQIKNVVENSQEKYLQQFSVTVFGSISTVKTVRKEFPRFSGAVIALSAFDSHIWSANVSTEYNYPIFIAESEPSITFSVPNNIKDFWAIFEAILKIHWNCILTISECANNNGRLVLMAIWPEGVIEDEVGDLVEKSIRNNPLLRRFQHALGMDKNAFIIFPINGNPNGTYHAYELYFIKDLLVVERVDSIILEDLLAFRYRRSNFRKVPIISVTQNDARFPVNAKHENVSGKLVLTGGAALDVLNIISGKLNFTVCQILGKGWIERTPNGTLTGMGQQLLKGEADVVLSRSEIMQYRIEQLSVTHTLHTKMLKAYFIKPVSFSVRDIYFTTFTPKLWLAILTMWLVFVATFLLFSCCKKKITSDNKIQGDDFVLGDVVLWFVSSASQQGWNSAPSETSLRIIFLSGKLATLILYAIFSSFMISKLSVEKDLIPLNSLKDLQHEGFEMYAHETSYNSREILKNIAGQSNSTPIFLNLKAGIDKISYSKSAFITEDGMIFGVEPNTSLCYFESKMKVEGGRAWYSLYFRKHDPTTKFFDYQFSMWDERGILKRMQLHYIQQTRPTCSSSDTPVVHLISLFDVVTPFLLFGAGAVLAVFSLTAEHFASSRKFNRIKDECQKNH